MDSKCLLKGGKCDRVQDSWGLIAQGSHMLGIVRPRTEDHHDMAFGFLKAGLNKGEMAVYVTKEDPVLVRRSMEKRWGKCSCAS